MPVFREGSSVWIEVDGKPVMEYAPRLLFDTSHGIETCHVYIPAEKGKDFAVCFSLAGTQFFYRRLEVRTDGHPASALVVTPHAKGGGSGASFGWTLTPTTIQRYAFGAIKTDENVKQGSRADNLMRMNGACVQVEFSDAYAYTNHYGPPLPVFSGNATIAAPVNPDSKVASLVGTQVQPGSVESMTSSFAPFTLACRPGAVRYVANFHYRPASLLVAQSIMPEPQSVVPHNGITQNSDSVRSSTNKRKHAHEDNATEPPLGGDPESKEDRKKRLRARLQIIKQELAEDDGPPPVIDIDAPPKPRVFVDLETGAENIRP